MRLKEQQQADLVKRYLTGESVTQIAISHRVNRCTIQRLMKRKGVNLRRQGGKHDKMPPIPHEVVEILRSATISDQLAESADD